MDDHGENRALLQLRQLLKTAERYLGAHYPARRLQVLSFIAQHEPVTYKQLWIGVDSEDSTVRRDINALTGGSAGPPLVIERPDDGSGRGVTMRLSEKGRDAVRALADMAAG